MVSYIWEQNHKQKEIDILDFTKIKTCASQDAMKKVNRQSTKWDEIFENHISHKGLASRIK